METPICTIIIPTRDCLEYLPAALDSVFAQDVRPIEVIVVDDGSSDGSAGWLREQASRHPELVVVEAGGVGPSAARNLAIARARADLIAFLDADDRWLTGKLAAQIAFHHSRPDVILSFTDYRHVGPQGQDRGTAFAYWPLHAVFRNHAGFVAVADAPSLLLAENAVGTSTVVARRDALQDASGFATDLASAEDWDLWLRLSRAGPVAVTGAVTADYAMRPGSETGNATARLEAMLKIVRRHRRAGSGVAPWAIRRAFARILTGRAELARQRGQHWRALSRHCWAFALAPSLRTVRAAASDAWRGVSHSLGLVGRNRGVHPC